MRRLSISSTLALGVALVMGSGALAGPQPETLPRTLDIKQDKTAQTQTKVLGVASDASAREKFQGKKVRRLSETDPVALADQRRLEVRTRLNVQRQQEQNGVVGNHLSFLQGQQAVEDFSRLISENGDRLGLHWNAKLGTPRHLSGSFASKKPSERRFTNTERAMGFLTDYKKLLRLEDPKTDLIAFQETRSHQGYTAIRYQQRFNGIEIWGNDLVVRLNPQGDVMGMSGHYRPTPKDVATVPVVEASRAEETAVRHMAATVRRILMVSEGASLRYMANQDKLTLVWRMELTGGLDFRQEVFVDAVTGEFIRSINMIHTDNVVGSGTDLFGQNRTLNVWEDGGTFYMINSTKPMFDNSSNPPNEGKGIIHLIDAQNMQGEQLFHVTSNNANSWSGANAVTAAYFADQVFDYYRDRFNRNSIDDNGMNMQLVVNFDNNFNNAFWNGSFMVFGNGDGNAFSDLAGSLDVTSHEMSHGVIEHTANLVYEFESGALNESFADVFGVSTDFYVNGNGFNWLLGEDVTSPNIPNDCLRNMENPDAANVAFNGQQPAHMDDFQVLTAQQDNGGVHINSGIPNRAYFLAANVIGIPAAEQIWYRALDQYLVRNSQFVDFRNAIIQAAEDLHGAGSTEVNAVIAGLDGVGIMGGNGTPPPMDLPDNTGTDFISAVDTDSGNIFRITPDFATVENISGNSILASGRPSFTDDGAAFTWVSNENVFVANSDGSGQAQLSSSGGFSGVAISPEGRYLAANSIFEDGIIQVFDLQDAQGDATYQLTSQNSTDGTVPDVVVGADVMEFTADGQFLIYDALNRTEFNGFQVEYWDINVLRLADGEIFRVFQALPQDESVGNPTFAQNNDNLIVFDYLTSDGNILIIAYDFNSNESGTVTNNFDFIGRPTFSGDDSEVYYEFPINEMPGIWRVTLNGLNGTMDDTNWAINAANPVWFTIGTRPVPVRLLAMETAWREDGVHLTWEVADAHEVLGFHVERGVDGVFTRANESLIPSRGENPNREVYTFTDRQPGDGGLVTYRVTGVTRNGAHVVLGSRDARRPNTTALPVLLPASPNPMRNATNIRLQIAGRAGGLATVAIYDLHGRKVTELFSGNIARNSDLDLQWNGRDAQGRRVASGSYFVRLSMFDQNQTQKISVLP